MDTVGPSALVVAILYFLGRWSLASVEYATSHPGKGRPAFSWQVTWWLAMVVSALGAASVHVMMLQGAVPGAGVLVFNAVVFGGFLIGFAATGHFDHKVRLGLRE